MENKKIYRAIIGGFTHYEFTSHEVDLLIGSGHVFASNNFSQLGDSIYLCSPNTEENFLREVISNLNELINKKEIEDDK